MLGIRLSGRTLVISGRAGSETHVHFDTKGEAVAIQVVTASSNLEPHTIGWKLKDKRSPWPRAQVLGQTDFWATLRSALRVSVGS